MTDDMTRQRLMQTIEELSRTQLELDREQVRRHHAEASLDQLLWSMSDAVLLVDPRGTVVQANPAAAELLGHELGGLEGVGLASLLPDTVPATPWALLDARPDGRLTDELTIAVDGGERAVSLAAAVIRDRSGKITGAVYAARDLSESQRLVRQLEAASERWRLLAGASDELASQLDTSDALVAIAASLRSSTGHDVAFVRSDGVTVDAVVVDAAPAVEDAVTTLVERPLPADTALGDVAGGNTPEMLLTRVVEGYPLLGVPVPEVRSALLFALTARGERYGAMLIVDTAEDAIGDDTVALVRQVADRVSVALSNATLRQSLGELATDQQVRQAREDLLAGVSHDMKTPLAILDGYVQMLTDGTDTLDEKEIHAGLRRHLRRLQRLVAQFLDFVRIGADRGLAVRLERADVVAVLSETIDTIDHADRVRLHTDPVPRVLADPDRLDQVFANLLTNALKYSPSDASVDVSVTLAGRTVRVIVADRGPGVDATDVERLFGKFTRGDDAGATEGSGLGLYVTNLVVQAVGGHLHVESRQGGGSRFVVSLPTPPED